MLHPGKHNDTAGTTMAGAIEAAFVNQWPLFNPDLPLPDEEQLVPMRLFFAAVAQGVVQHLRDNPGAFTLSVGNATQGVSHSHPSSVAQITAQQTTA